MPNVRRPVTVATMIATAVALAAPAQAAPECTDLGPTTRMCTRSPGHTAIITTPNPALSNPWPGWGFGGPGYGFGTGGGIWIGF